MSIPRKLLFSATEAIGSKNKEAIFEVIKTLEDEIKKRDPHFDKPFFAFEHQKGTEYSLMAGAIMFSLLGKNPAEALYFYFIDPLREV